MDSVGVAVVVTAAATATGSVSLSRGRSAEVGGNDGGEKCCAGQMGESKVQGVECNAMQTAAEREPS